MYNYGKPVNFDDWLIDLPDEFSFWLDDQMAMITPLDIVLMAVGLLVIVGLIWFFITRQHVLECSPCDEVSQDGRLY